MQTFVHTENASQLLLIYVLSKIADKEGIARRVIFSVLQENKILSHMMYSQKIISKNNKQ